MTENPKTTTGELQNLQLVTTLSNTNHKVEIYSANGKFQTGYNDIYFQIKNSDGSTVNNAEAAWTPVMYMAGMSHSCPVSSVSKKSGVQSTYGGYIVFQMAGSDMEYWELTIDYTVGGTKYTVKDKIQVVNSPKRVLESFQGIDGKRYILAMVSPAKPIVAVNDIKAVVYHMESMMNFVIVDNYKIKIDPRMPGMGNHSSPNNVDLTQGTDKMYHGKLSLTMTGYWKISLQLEDASGIIQKGEKISGNVESSSIYFELEF